MRIAYAAAMLLALLLVRPALAHDALPISLTLDRTGAQEYSLRGIFPPSFPPGMEPQPGVAPPCSVSKRQGSAVLIRCPDGAAPPALTLAFPGLATNAPILLRLSLADGERNTIVSAPGTVRIELPEQLDRKGVFAAYAKAGVGHIATGFDHLLFLVCLMLIAAGPARIAWTVTGFTLGHALTISLATLELVMVDAGTVEILIALSIVFAAAEIARGKRASLTWRRPALVAALFGLLHGLGFAGALGEIGLPHSEVPLALLAFNLGIEAGQLVFVVALFGLAWVLMRLWRSPLSPAPAAWPIGLVASFWFFERLAEL